MLQAAGYDRPHQPPPMFSPPAYALLDLIADPRSLACSSKLMLYIAQVRISSADAVVERLRRDRCNGRRAEAAEADRPRAIKPRMPLYAVGSRGSQLIRRSRRAA